MQQSSFPFYCYTGHRQPTINNFLTMNNNLQVQRHELKYYINQIDYQSAKSVLSQLMKQDSHQTNSSGYFIRSLYLDDLYDNSVEEKLAGIEKRDKYRLRIYDCKQNWVKLERKRKNGNFVNKTTTIITKREALHIINGQYKELAKNYHNPDTYSIYYDFCQKYFHPVCIVDYYRDVFMLDYNDIRITFDKQLRCNNENYDLFNPHLFTEPLMRPEIIVMEIKFNHFLPAWFKNIIHLESVTASAVSKYCQSRMHTKEYYFD